ncbi:MAG: 50S ribosomal protein L17 [Armatimonadetes bacterium]|nr:50S ribosomal protein L17 [Armatimonadota bacterium]MBS1710763.1 50S ribosomal protein L17 [Armatimonadota bacterium]MBX3108434.1 50S ribosomal protein L17 [Fimbriimonadaceae bacterium]
MRHKVDRRKLGLPSDQRKALLTNLARQFVRHGYVHTTMGRAKELRRIVERLITLGKKDTLASRREARKVLVGHSSSSAKPQRLLAGKSDAEKMQILVDRSLINGEDLVKHLFDNVAPRYASRNGGYTRLTRTGQRRGDAAETAVLELVD